MNIYTQKKIVFKLLVKDYKNGAKGINSVWIRETYNIVDVATRMFDNKEAFKKLGLRFDKRRQADGTATYYLKPFNESTKPVITTPKTKLYRWEKYTNAEGYEVMRQVSI